MSVRMMLIAATVVAALGAGGSAFATEPSATCGAGTSTPVGVSVLVAQNATAPSARVCNNGSVFPAPGRGAVTVSANTSTQTAYVDIDGDSANRMSGGPSCTTGFDRLQVSPSGAVFYNSGSGSYGDYGQKKASDPATAVGNVRDACS